MRELLNRGAELEPRFSGNGQDYYQAVLRNPDLTNGNGQADLQKVRWHLNYLERNHAPSQTQSQQPSQTQTQTQSQGNNNGGGNQQPATGGGGASAQIAINFATGVANRSGTYYQLGANGPHAWDCSSLTQAAFAQAGVNLPRTSGAQAQTGQAVAWENKQPGDLMFWSSGGRVYHVAIYIGGGRIVDAGSPASGISVRPIFGSPDRTLRRVL